MIKATLNLYFFTEVPSKYMIIISGKVVDTLLHKMSLQKNPEIQVAYSKRIISEEDDNITVEVTIMKDESSICNNTDDEIERAFLNAFYTLNPTNYEIIFRGF